MTTIDTLLQDYPDNVPVSVAAKLLGKPVPWVNIGLQMGTLPFGTCVNKERASFHIAPRALYRYLTGEMQLPLRDLIDAVSEKTAKQTAAAIMEQMKKEGLRNG